MNAEFIREIVDRVPNDPALASNGGDYWHWRKIYELADGRKFCLYKTSADADFCQITGSFTKTRGLPLMIDGEEVTVNGNPLWVWAAEWMAYQEYASPHILDSESI